MGQNARYSCEKICRLVLDLINTEYKIKPFNSRKPESFVICC